MNTLYQATTNATGGRAGHVLSEDGPIDMALSVPKSMGGDDGSGVNKNESNDVEKLNNENGNVDGSSSSSSSSSDDD